MIFFLDFLFLAAALFTIYLGVAVWIRGSTAAVYKAFAVFAISLGLWAVSLVLLNQTSHIVFGTITLFFATVSIASLPLFMYTFPHGKIPRKWFWLIYLPLLPTLVALVSAPA